jgi:hypothetical protein
MASHWKIDWNLFTTENRNSVSSNQWWTKKKKSGTEKRVFLFEDITIVIKTLTSIFVWKYSQVYYRKRKLVHIMQIKSTDISYYTKFSEFSWHKCATILSMFDQEVRATHREIQKRELPAKVQRIAVNNHDWKFFIAGTNMKFLVNIWCT